MRVRHDWFSMAVLVAGSCTATLVLSGCQSSPTSVQSVADLAVTAARDLDVTAGASLLCAPPSQKNYDTLTKGYIEPVTQALGGRKPEVSYTISDVLDVSGSGSFVVTIATTEPALAGSGAQMTIVVKSVGGRSCIDLDATFGPGSVSPGDHAEFRLKK